MKNTTTIGTICNHYGSLHVKQDDDGKCYWSIEDYDGHTWEEIPEALYRSLLRFEKKRFKGPFRRA